MQETKSNLTEETQPWYKFTEDDKKRYEKLLADYNDLNQDKKEVELYY